MQHFLLDAKTIERKKGVVTYLQRAEDIIDFLILVEAKQALEEVLSLSRSCEKRAMISIEPIMLKWPILTADGHS